MSIATEISRLQTAKADLKTAIEAKGVTVPSSATIDTYDDYVSQITSGGGGSSSADTALKGIIDKSIASFEIPSGVTSIGDYCFYNCGSLSSITIPSGVTSIGDYCFSNCTSLKRLNSDTDGVVNIPSGITSITRDLFYFCTSILLIYISNTVTNIGVRAFANCNRLTSVTIEATTPPTLANANAFSSTNNCIIYVPSGSVETYKTSNNWSTYASRIQAIPNS